MTRLSPQDGLPLPELVDFRMTGDRKKVILFIREGEAFYRRHLKLNREGAGLYALLPGIAMFARHNRRMSTTEHDEAVFERHVRQKFLTASVCRELAEALALVFWRQELGLADWPEQEGVPAAHLGNADSRFLLAPLRACA